jgi:uncharacterized protein involved in exopolysaccharide biosynthesis
MIPLEALQNAFRFWWFLFCLAVAGGLAGMVIHGLRPPVYEAVARFSASIDFVSTGPLTQLEEDIAIDSISDLAFSSAVMERVAEKARAQGIATSAAELKKSALFERRVNVWDLRLRSTDPQRAEQLANIWVDEGQAALLDSYQHALEAERLNRVLRGLESCLERAAASEPSSAQCSRYRFADIQADLQEAGQAYARERIASGGLSAGLRIGPVDHAVLPTQPVILGRSQLVLAGCLLGFLSGFVMLQFGIPRRWMGKR